MSAAFFLLILGGLLVYSGFENVPFGDLLQGKTQKRAQSLTSDIGNITANVGSASASVGSGAIAGSAAISGKGGVSTFDGKPVASWIVPILTVARKLGWTGHVISGYRSAAEQARICAHTSGPCATPGTSNHQKTQYPGGAVDVTNGSQLAAILHRLGPGAHGLQQGPSADPNHFSVHRGGSY